MSFKSAIDAVHFMSWRDIGLFRKSARTDAAIHGGTGGRAAFEAAYADPDPWASADPAYRYQRRKYEVLLSLLPDRPYGAALDLGCGVGVMSRLLAGRAGSVLGLDVAAGAVAAAAANAMPGVRFEQADILDLPGSLDGQFDLLVLADTLYYLRPIDDGLLKALALRTARLLASGGVCLLANHFFSGADADSRLSRRIHQAFTWSPAYAALLQHRRPFYLVSLLQKA